MSVNCPVGELSRFPLDWSYETFCKLKTKDLIPFIFSKFKICSIFSVHKPNHHKIIHVVLFEYVNGNSRVSSIHILPNLDNLKKSMILIALILF